LVTSILMLERKENKDYRRERLQGMI